jgi:hypothetical protein
MANVHARISFVSFGVGKTVGFGLMLAGLAFALSSSSAVAETCSDRAGLCQGACTPQNVTSGAQYGGTVTGCQKSCRSRLQSCLKNGIWTHMGSQTMGQQQKVDRR